jgi:hypothetical protein
MPRKSNQKIISTRLLSAKDLFKFESFELIAVSYEQNAYSSPPEASSTIYQIDFALISCSNNFTVCTIAGIIFFTPQKN